jgi:LPXTG-site transpeptidase (sortase) family protein
MDAHNAGQQPHHNAKLSQWLGDAGTAIWEAKMKFLFAFFMIFMFSYGFLFMIDFVPEEPTSHAEEPALVIADDTEEPTVSFPPDEDARPRGAPFPDRITIEKLDLDVAVLNPQSRTIADLDAALLKGAVRHPDSADFNNTGTMLVFGHSSYLPVVHNSNYKAFNGIQNLEEGDVITLTSADRVYTYRVEKVYKAAASQTELALDHSEERLVLVTCNSFGSKDDRFVVEAVLAESDYL